MPYRARVSGSLLEVVNVNVVRLSSSSGKPLPISGRISPKRPEVRKPSKTQMAERGTRVNEKAKGTLEPGKLADLVILENNPLDVPSDTIGDIAALETIKERKTIWCRSEP